jgi:hypothetical protein
LQVANITEKTKITCSKLGPSAAAFFCPKCAKTHIRASVTPKSFFGSLALAIQGKAKEGGEGEREGGKKGGREREKEGGIVESKKSLEYGLICDE